MTDAAPQHWHSYAGPANWFQIWHPPSWQPRDADGFALLDLPDDGGTLTLHSFWVSPNQSVDPESAIDLTSIFPKRRRVRRLPSLKVPYESRGLSGEAVVGKTSPWWKRPFSRQRWQPWRVWMIRHKAVCLLAVFQPSDTPDPELETVLGMVLNTISFAVEPADPPEIFADRVQQLARRKFPLLNCESGEDFQMTLGESNINLFNFYRSYLNDPTRFEEILLPALTTVVQVQEWGQQQTDPALDDVRDRILPMLYPEAVWRESFPNFVGTPWVAGLMILYVVDESQAYWYIRNDLLEAWDLTQDQLHALALANLDDYFERNDMELSLAGEEDGTGLLIPNQPDAYNSARLLSESFQQEVRKVLGAQFAVGVPNRDFFVAVSLDAPESVEQMRRQVAEDFTQMDHPLSDRLLLVSADGVSEL